MPKHWRPIKRENGIYKVESRKTRQVVWGFIIYVNGKTVQRSGFTSKAEAMRIKYEEFMDRKFGYKVGSRALLGNGNGSAPVSYQGYQAPREPDAPDSAATVPVSEMFDSYIRSRTAAGVGRGVIQDATRIKQRLESIFFDHKIVTLRDLSNYKKGVLVENRDAMQQYVWERREIDKVSENSIKQEIKRLKTIMNSVGPGEKAKGEAILTHVEDFRVPSLPKIKGVGGVRDRFLTFDELTACLTKADPYLRDFLQILYLTGVRSMVEMERALLRTAVDFTPREYAPGGVSTFLGKDGKIEELILSNRAARILKARFEAVAATGRPPERQHAFDDPGYRMLSRRFKAVCKKLGIKWGRGPGQVTLHTFRHTIATHLGKAKIDDKVIRTITRHADPNAKNDTLNNVYKHTEPDQFIEALEYLDARLAFIDDLPR